MTVASNANLESFEHVFSVACSISEVNSFPEQTNHFFMLLIKRDMVQPKKACQDGPSPSCSAGPRRHAGLAEKAGRWPSASFVR